MAKKEKQIKMRWYYDANTLSEKQYKEIIREITDRHYPKIAVISHLSLGEAYCNIFKKEKEQIDAIKGFLSILEKSGHLEIVGNEVSEDLFDDVYGILHSTAGIPDIIHAATALTNNCCNLLTDDRGLNGIEGTIKMTKLKGVAAECGVDNFCITRRRWR